MPNIQDIKLKSIEQEQIPEQNKSIEQGVEAIPALEKEKSPEINQADKQRVLDEIAQAEKTATSNQIAPITPVQQKYREREKHIENILAEGLVDLYIKMPPDKQSEFKQEGEATAKKINSLLEQAKVKASTIIDLIRKWLKIIPGVNKFFLEQEAKIKADEIMNLKRQKSEDS